MPADLILCRSFAVSEATRRRSRLRGSMVSVKRDLDEADGAWSPPSAAAPSPREVDVATPRMDEGPGTADEAL